jgi:hypothetical protein
MKLAKLRASRCALRSALLETVQVVVRSRLWICSTRSEVVLEQRVDPVGLPPLPVQVRALTPEVLNAN